MPLSEVAAVCNPDLTIESVELNGTCAFCLLEDVRILPLDHYLKKRVKLGICWMLDISLKISLSFSSPVLFLSYDSTDEKFAISSFPPQF
jgi:hypothetical protein